MRAFRHRLAIVTAVLTLGCGSDGLVLPDAQDPASIVALDGGGQTGPAGSVLPLDLVVRVTDGTSRPVPNRRVAFVPVGASGSTDPDTALTDSDGRATARWTLGATIGTQTVQARVVPASGTGNSGIQVTFTATATPGNAAAIAAVRGTGQEGVVGSPLPDSLVVRVVDRLGNPVPNIPVEWAVVGGGSVSASPTVTGPDGRTGVIRTLGPTPGEQRTTASVEGLEGSPVEFVAIALVGSAGKLAIVRQPSATASSGQPFATQPQTQLVDANDNPVAEPGLAITATIASGPAGGTLIGSTTVATNAAGLASFTNLGVSGPAGEYFLNFAVPSRQNIAGVTSELVTVGAGAPARLAFVVQPSNAAAGAAIAPPVRVAVQDAQGNLVAGATNAVTIAIGTNPGGGTLSGTRTVAATGGIATFGDLSIDRAGNGYTLVATAGGLQSATSEAFNIGVGSPASLAIVTQPSSSATTGQPFAQQPAVGLRDAQGNAVVQAGVTVTVSIASGGGTLGGDTSVETGPDGVARFTDLRITGAAGPRTLRFESPGLTPVVSATIALGGAGAPAQIVAERGNGQNATVGTAVPIAPAVKVTDANGNPVPGVQVTFAVTAGGGEVTGATPTTGSDGVAAVGSWKLGPTVGTNRLTATAAGSGIAGNPVEFTATAVAGSANRLTIETQPSSTAQSGAALATQPSVQLRDANGNPVAQGGVGITASIASGPAGATLTNASAVTNASGRATFSGLAINGPVGEYTLSFGGTGLVSVTSSTITLAAGAASKLVLVQAPSATVQSGIDFPQQPVVQVQDAHGNPVNGNRNVTVVISEGGGTLGGMLTRSTSGGSTATYTNLRITGTVGPRTLLFTSGGLTAVEANVTVTAGAPAAGQSSLTASPTTINVGETSDLTVVVRDASGNAIAGASVTLSATGGGNTFGSASLTTAANGQATTTFASTEPGSRTITAQISAPGGPPIQETASVTVQAVTTTTSLATSANPSLVGDAVTFTATVTSGAGTPTGQVQFRAGASNLGDPVALSGGVATLTTAQLPAGTHSITAQYLGGGAFQGSTSNAVSQVVNRRESTTTIALPGGPIAIGPVTVEVAVAGDGPAPTGTVTVTATFAGSTATCTVAAPSGTCELTLPLPGLWSITASYPGDAVYEPSTSSAGTIEIAAANLAPDAQDDAFEGSADTELAVGPPGVLANDTDPENAPLTAELRDDPANGTVTLNDDGSFVYAPNPGFSGSDEFTYVASDGAADSAPATVGIAVGAPPAPPGGEEEENAG